MPFKVGKYAFIAVNRMLSFARRYVSRTVGLFSIFELESDVEEERISSTCLVRARLNKETGEMILDFTDGSKYMYHGVTEDDFEELRDAASKGQHFNYSIRDKFSYERIS